ncbi:hypothetical protein [Gordonia sp. (in: high G+C Gram-positive bacteria)]|uniref:hypothetical protein n=1 Tax=Gordonia sp. (in: high G+C Gram-positive bacteria) TaxID=84139 RepID=UPI0039E50F4E
MRATMCGLVAIALVSLVGCTRTENPSPPTTITTTVTASTVQGTTRTAPSQGTAVDPADYQGPGGHFFASPSAKWHCGIVAASRQAGCHGPMPADAPAVPGSGAPDTMVRPNSIVVAWGNQMARFTSIGDPQFMPDGPNSRPLPYGRSLTVGNFTCTVAQTTGVTCTNTLSHHGFTVSDHAYELR